MKNMNIDCIKKAIAVFVALTFTCTAAFAASAHEPNSPAHRNRAPAAQRPVRDFLQQLSETLNLTEAQKITIKPILAAEANDIKAVHQDTTIAPEQKQAKMKEIRDNTREKINAALTPEQQKKFAEMKGKTGNRMREAFTNRMTAVAEQLNLTEEQKTAIKPIMTAEVNDIRAVMQDNSLTKEQKQTKIAGIRDASDKKINDILTPEQQAKWAKLKEHAKQPRNKKGAPAE
jgi:Spy/CpxP family protein refolding chaperone